MKSRPEEPWYAIENAAEVPSPALLVYPDRVEANLRRMLSFATAERLCPHVKTHKMSALVERQRDLGIRKFKCATLAELEIVGRAGADEALLAMQPVGPAIDRLIGLAHQMPQTRFSTLVDCAEAATALGEAARAAGMELSVYLDLDCGMHRTGVAPGKEAAQLYHFISRQNSLRPAGLHAYDGHIRDGDPTQRKASCETAFKPVSDLAQNLTREGLPVPAIIVGGSPTFPIHAQRTGVECSPGTVVFWDAGYTTRFPDLPFEPAACVLTRVVSKPGPDLLCLDLGHKAIAAENPHPRVAIQNLGPSEAVGQSEEHLVLRTSEAARHPIGTVFYGVPMHICPTVALYAEAVLVNDRRASGRWTITARHRL